MWGMMARVFSPTTRQAIFVAALMLTGAGIGLIAASKWPAAAEDAQPRSFNVDPRLAGPTIQAQGAMIALREAEFGAAQEDGRKALAAQDEKLKWVLDNWAKQPEAKPQ